MSSLDALSAFADLPDGVLVAGPDGLVVTLNPAGARLLGTAPADAYGRHWRAVVPLADLAGRDWWACTDPYGGLDVRSGQPERLLELVGGPRKGTQLLVTARYVRGPDRRVAKLVLSLRDTRARERHDRDRADLVSTVAHEIRSPLTTVKGFTATLLSKWDRLTDEHKRTMLQAVIVDADRVNRLLSDLLDASRIDAGRLSLRRQVVDLPAAARRVVAGRVASGDPPDRFRVQADAGLPETWLDPDRVAQVLSNLVENAVRHGEGLVTVSVAPTGVGGSAGAGPNGVEVTVADRGRGVPDEARPRIFAPFWRGGSADGHGLGLYVVKGIVEAHGGTVEVARRPGGGALFRVLLPAGTAPYAD